MPAPDRRTRLSPDERRRQLVAIGVGMLADRPLEAISIEALAEEAGVSRGSVFRYFGSKPGLHHELVSTARDALMHATEPRRELAPHERLLDTISRFVTFSVEHRATFYSLVRGAAAADATVRAIVDEVRDAQTERLLEVFGDLGVEATPRLRLGLRAWVSLAEQALVDEAATTVFSHSELAAFLVGSAEAVAGLTGSVRAG